MSNPSPTFTVLEAKSALDSEGLPEDYIVFDTAENILAQIEDESLHGGGLIASAHGLGTLDDVDLDLTVDQVASLWTWGVVITNGYNIVDTAENIVWQIAEDTLSNTKVIENAFRLKSAGDWFILSVEQAVAFATSGAIADFYIIEDTIENFLPQLADPSSEVKLFINGAEALRALNDDAVDLTVDEATLLATSRLYLDNSYNIVDTASNILLQIDLDEQNGTDIVIGALARSTDDLEEVDLTAEQLIILENYSVDIRAGYTLAYEIAGVAEFWKGKDTFLQGVEVSVSGISQTDTSDQDGTFALGQIKNETTPFSLNAIKRVTSTKASDAGITLTDVLAALKVYLGKSLPGAYASPFNFIAADFNGSGTVDLSDVLQLLKFYLGKQVSEGYGPAWIFVDKNDIRYDGKGEAISIVSDTNGVDLSKAETRPPSIFHDGSTTQLELIGVLRGDVDGSWSPGT